MSSQPPFTIKESDGSPRLTQPTELIVPNGSLSVSGRRATLTFGGGGGGGGDMLAANNLSELTNSATARSNLGLVIGTNVLAPNGNGSSLTALNASALGSGTVPDARFPATLPAASGVNLTTLNASNIASGSLADARLSANIPLKNAANGFSATQTFTPAVNTSGLVISGYSLTGTDTHPILDLSGTWNVGSSTPIAIKLNITDTLSGSGALFIALQKDSTNVFSISKDGAILASTLEVSGSNTVTNANGSLSMSVDSDSSNLNITGGKFELNQSGGSDGTGYLKIDGADFSIGEVPSDGFIDFSLANSLLRIGVGGRTIKIGDSDGQGNGLVLRVDDLNAFFSITGAQTVFSYDNAATITPCALVSMDTTDGGFLPPRMTEAQRDAIGSPVEGLIVHNTTTHSLDYFNGTIWEAAGGSGNLTVGTTPIASGTTTRILYDNAGTLGEYSITGTGNVVMSTSATLVTPALGTPSALVLTSATGLPPTTGIVGWPANASGVLTNNGSGTLSWGAGGGASGANPSASVGLTAVNGVATTFLRSDGAPALDQSIVPTWTGVHTFTPAARSSGIAPYLKITTPADTAQTLNTEFPGIVFGGDVSNATVTRTGADGTTYALQREYLFVHPTYAFAGATTVTNSATVAIPSAPVAGLNATLTNRYALLVGPAPNSGSPISEVMLVASSGTRRALTLQGSSGAGGAEPLFAITDYTAGANVMTIDTAGQMKTSFLAATAAAFSVPQNSQIGFSGTNIAQNTLVGLPAAWFANSGSGASRIITVNNDTSAIGAMLQNSGGRQRVVADVTNTTATFAAITGLGFNAAASGKYTGRLVIKCNNSTAAEGIKFDFNGGTATATSFWAAGNQIVGGTDVLGSGISTSLAGVINFSTITGETLIIIDFSLVVNGAGTVIPRFAENSTALGTATVELGSFMWTESMPL